MKEYHLPTFKQYLHEVVKAQKGEKPPTKEQIKKLEDAMQKYYDISAKIDNITAKYEAMLDKELKKLPADQGKLVTDIENTIKKLKIRTIKSNGVIGKFRKAYQQTRVGYKDLWETSLKKVNSEAKKAMESLVEQFTQVVDVKGKIVLLRERIQEANDIKDYYDMVEDEISGILGRDFDLSELDNTKLVDEGWALKQSAIYTAEEIVKKFKLTENLDEGIADDLKAFYNKVKDTVKKGTSYVVDLFKKSTDKLKKILPNWEKATDDLEKVTRDIK